jgi:L-fucose isomerase-like protein
VSAHVELNIGQQLTIARLPRNLEEVMRLRGDLVDCRDTTACRTTISARVSDVRKFVQCALATHHAVIYGDYARETKALTQTLDIGSLEL